MMHPTRFHIRCWSLLAWGSCWALVPTGMGTLRHFTVASHTTAPHASVCLQSWLAHAWLDAAAKTFPAPFGAGANGSAGCLPATKAAPLTSDLHPLLIVRNVRLLVVGHLLRRKGGSSEAQKAPPACSEVPSSRGTFQQTAVSGCPQHRSPSGKNNPRATVLQQLDEARDRCHRGCALCNLTALSRHAGMRQYAMCARGASSAHGPLRYPENGGKRQTTVITLLHCQWPR